MVFSRFTAHGTVGRLKTELMLVPLIGWLVHTMMTLLVMLVTMFRLRATKTMVVLALCRVPCSILSIRVRTAMLSVAAGLLVTTMLGLPVTVTVTTMCRCTLLENLRGKDPRWLLGLGTLIRPTSLTEWLRTRRLATPGPRAISVLPTRLLTENIGARVESGLRKITVTFPL